MRLPLPSIERITGFGLLVAAFTILVLAVIVVYEVRRGGDVNREVIAAQHMKDALESLRSGVHELKYAALERSLASGAGATRAIDRRTVEIEADLAYLEARAGENALLDQHIGPLVVRTRAFVAQVRSGALVAPAGGEDGDVEVLASGALELALLAQTRRINEQASEQIRLGENLNYYVSLLLAGSVCVLAGLFAVFQHAQAKARVAQRKIERLAHFDTVTGLPNRALLVDRLAQELARSRRSKSGFALAVFDLDGFKQVNDSHGHAAGDAVLAEVGRRARAGMRASDTVGRLGGDEFMAILPGATSEGALQVAEKLRCELSQPYRLGGREHALSASVGVSFYPQDGEDADALFRAADGALYAAKREGKNQTRLAGRQP